MTFERNVKGLLGTKLGMTQLWDENNRVVPVTVIQAGPCVVTQVRSAEKDGYSAVQLGFGAIKAKKVTKPAAGHFAKADVTPRKNLVELRTADASEFALGQELTAAQADWQIHAFGGAKHAFMNPGANMPDMGIEYHEATAHRAWTAMAGFLGEVLA